PPRTSRAPGEGADGLMARIAVVGAGYVGLTTGACFAHLGHHVVCVDVEPEKIERLSRGDVPILEAGLDELVRDGLPAGRPPSVHDFLNADRIVIGCEDPAAAGRVARLFERIQAPVIVTDPASAETIKYASNAFLATKVSFVNAIANVCEAVGADVREVVLGM